MADQDEMAQLIERPELTMTAQQYCQAVSDSLIMQQNWGNLLAAAPLALSHLGACQIVAGSPVAGSFTLVRPDHLMEILPHKTLRGNLTMLCNIGRQSFLEAEKRMITVTELTQYISAEEGPISSIVKCLQDPNTQVIKYELPDSVTSMGRLVKSCEASLLDIERTFALWLKTADALMEVTVETQGDAERQSSVDKLKLSQREWEKKGMEKMVAEDKESMERLKQQMKLSEEAFKTAQEAAGTNDVWQSIGQNIVENLSSNVLTLLNSAAASFNPARLMDKVLRDGGQPTHNSAEADSDAPAANSRLHLSDPGIGQIGTLASAVVFLLEIGKNDSVHEGELVYPKANLNLVRSGLQSPPVLGSCSAEMEAVARDASQICAELEEEARSQRQLGKTDATLDRKALASRLQTLQDRVVSLEARINSGAGQGAGSKPPKLVDKMLAAKTSVVHARLAQKAAEFQTTAANLEASRALHDAATQKLNDDIAAVRHLQAEIASLSSGAATLNDVRRVLGKAISALTKLQEEVTQLVSFFQSLSAIVHTTAEGPCADLVRVLERGMTANEEVEVSGFNYLEYKKQDLYNLCLIIRARFNIIHDVSRLYTIISHEHILPGINFVNSLGQSGEHIDGHNGELIRSNNVTLLNQQLKGYTDKACSEIKELAGKKQASVQRRERERAKKLEQLTNKLPSTRKSQIKAVVQKEINEQTQEMVQNRLLPGGFEEDF